MSDDAIEYDKFEPNYKGKCECCGQSPTVTAVKNNVVVNDWGMCGVCTFGTAKALDPDWWNNGED